MANILMVVERSMSEKSNCSLGLTT